jgi:hypothetical protein
MTVGPADRSHIQASTTGKPRDLADGKQPAARQEEPATTPNSIVEKVEAPSAAQALNQLPHSENIESNTIPAKRMKKIQRRVADGTYDKPDVIDEIARRVVDDL